MVSAMTEPSIYSLMLGGDEKHFFEVTTDAGKEVCQLSVNPGHEAIKVFTDESIKVLCKQLEDFKKEQKVFCNLKSSNSENFCLIFHFKKISCSGLTDLLHDKTKIAYDGVKVLFTPVDRCNTLDAIVNEILFSITNIVSGVVHRWREFKEKELETFVKITSNGVQYHIAASLCCY